MAKMSDNVGDAVGNAIKNALGISTILLDQAVEIIKSRGPIANYSYSNSWASTRKRYGLQTSRVDLLFSGEMLDSIQPSPENQKFEFVPSGTGSKIRGAGGLWVKEADYIQSIEITDEKAPWHEFGTRRIPSRPFFGLSDQEAQALYSNANRALASSTSGPVRGETLTASLFIRGIG